MPGTPTANLGLIVPTVGGDTNTWGTEINSDLVIIDTLAVCLVINTSVNIVLPLSNPPETIVRVTTGASTITVTLPSPTVIGKIYTIKKIDSGLGIVSILPASGTIDGQTSWVCSNQYVYVRIQANGAGYDVIG